MRRPEPIKRGGRQRLLAILLISAATVFTTAADWPTYLHDTSRNGAQNETIVSAANAGQLTKLWSFKTGGLIAAQAAIVGGVAYVGSWDGNEYAINLGTGAQMWKTNLGVTKAPNCVPATIGITSSATVDSGVVYVGGGDAYLYALDAGTGAVLWRAFTGDNSATGGHYNWSSPLLYAGNLYVGIASNCDIPLVQGQLLQISTSTHQVVNTLNLVPATETGAGIWTSPVVDPATNTIFVTTGTLSLWTQNLAQAIIAIDATTLAVKSSWSIPFTQAGIDLDWGTSPDLITDANGRQLVAATNKDGLLYAFDRSNLAAGPVWQTQVAVTGSCPPCGDASVSSTAFGGGTVFAAGGNTTIQGSGYGGAVRAVDPSNGAVKWEHGTPDPIIPAVTYVNGLVIDAAGATLEVLNAADGTRLYSYQTGAGIYGAPSISQGSIVVGSGDGNLYAFALPANPPPAPPPDPNCPTGWVCQDIGGPTPPGSEAVFGGQWQVLAGGTGVQLAADQFRFLSSAAPGDSQLSARVTARAPANAGRAGLMVRQRADPDSPYYAVFAAPGNAVVVQYRTAFGGPTTVANQVVTGGLPQYIMVQRIGDRFSASTSVDGTNYTLVPGGTSTIVMPLTALTGLAVSAGGNPGTGQATYTNVTLGTPSNVPVQPVGATPCPAGWSCSDVGNPKLVGDQRRAGAGWTVKGAGVGIIGYADQFHFVWRPQAADTTVTAHLLSQTNTSGGARAGVMLRQTDGAGSAYYGAFLAPNNSLIIQTRSIQGLRTTQVTKTAAGGPTYIRVTRWGSIFSTYTSPNGVDWTFVPRSNQTMSLGTVLAGLAVGSNNAIAMDTTTLDTVSMTSTATPPPVRCPAAWSCGDIANSVPTGDESLNAQGGWTINGGGSDIWSIVDQFHFTWQSLPGDGYISAHVTGQTVTDPYAKGGVMLRQSIDPGAPYYAAFTMPGNVVAVQYRSTQGGTTNQMTIGASIPVYLLAARTGNSFTAFTSPDGVNWTPIPGSGIRMPAISGSLVAGLAVTSHNISAASTVNFDLVQISAAAGPAYSTCPAGWSCADIGQPPQIGSQSFSNGTWTVGSGGTDIWGTADQFHLTAQTVNADGTVGGQVTTQTYTDPWAKAGFMLRQGNDPGAPYYYVFVTPGNGVGVQYREVQGRPSLDPIQIAGAAPAYLQVARSGSTFTAYGSSDGVTWTPIAGSSRQLPISGPLLGGLAVTSHSANQSGTATFAAVTISQTAPLPPGQACPAGWTCADIGNPGAQGGQYLTNGVWSIIGGGADIWGASDQFHYVSQALAGDGSISGHLTAQTYTDPWAKAGLMQRVSSDPAAPFYMVAMTPGNGIVVQFRDTQGGNVQNLTGIVGTMPAYLRVTRAGTTFTAYTSADGITWTAIPGSGLSLNMTGQLLSGMAITSHSGTTTGTATIDSVVTAP